MPQVPTLVETMGYENFFAKCKSEIRKASLQFFCRQNFSCKGSRKCIESKMT